MHWPQIVLIFIAAINNGIDIQRHGEPKTGKHNAWEAMIRTIIIAALLWFGGFWS